MTQAQLIPPEGTVTLARVSSSRLVIVFVVVFQSKIPMADEAQYSVNTDTTTPPSLKRKYNNNNSDDQPPPTRVTGFSDAPPAPAPPSYNSVPPPAATDFEIAKQRAQEVAARLLGGTPAPDAVKRTKFDNGGPTTG